MPDDLKSRSIQWGAQKGRFFSSFFFVVASFLKGSLVISEKLDDWIYDFKKAKVLIFG